MTERSILTQQIKAGAESLGFFSCGVAKAGPVDETTAERVRRWIGSKGYASMEYMANHTDMRLDPRLLMPEVRSIVCVAMNYAPARHIPEGQYQLAAYAYGQDYHDLVRQRLHQLAAMTGMKTYRAFCDSAPVLERYWAVRAGLGWTGRNHQLIIPRAGSMFFLGELFTDFELDYDTPMPSRCGRCRRCVDACPTHALSMPGDDGIEPPFDASRCISYQTIENRGSIPEDIKQCMGDTIYGCDRCQQACPWNRYATPTTEPTLQPRDELLAMTKDDWQSLTEEDYRRLFKGSAVKRAKYSGLMRNIGLHKNEE